MKKFTALLLIIFAFGAVVFGAYLPFVRARLFIAAMGTKIGSIEQFQNVYDQVFNFPSYIGDEEIAKYLINTIDGWIGGQQDPQSEAAMRELVAYIEPRAFLNNPRHLLLLGNIYNNFWLKYKKEEDFTKATGYFRSIIEIGPNLPHGLYSLLSLYYQAGRPTETKEIAEKILAIWPNDQTVKGIVASLK